MILRYQIFIGVFFSSLFFAWHVVGRKFGLLAGILLSFVLLDAVIFFQWPMVMNDEFFLRLRAISASSFAEIACLVYFISILTSKNIARLLVFFEVLLVVDLLFYLFNGYGIFNSGSMDMSFMAMAYPLLAFRPIYSENLWQLNWRFFIMIFPLICLFFGVPGTACYVALATGIGTFLFLTKKIKLVLPVSGAILGIGIWVLSHSDGFFSWSGRHEAWKLFFTWWRDNADIWLGTGTGTFQWLGPTIQSNVDPSQVHGFFLFMHSDFLQILFEQGIIGLSLTLLMTGLCLYRARKYPWLFASCISSIIIVALQFPLRFLFSQLLILILMRLCLDEESLNQIENP